MEKILAADIEEALLSQENQEQRKILMRFFKTEPGQYGEGDRFIGLKVPQTREVVKFAKGKVPFDEISILIHSPWHEIRLAGFLLLVEEMKAALPKRNVPVSAGAGKRKYIAEFYLRHARFANNWDLVDLSCEYILGPYLRLAGLENSDVLDRLAQSDNLWEQRIAIVTTIDFIRNNIFEPTFRISDMLLNHPHDLIHKAVGWMLRETGKRDKDALLAYLEENFSAMPRTALRYAIERFPEPERRYWLSRK